MKFLYAFCAVSASLILLFFLSLPRVERLQVEYPRIVYKGPQEPFEVEMVEQKPVHWAGITQISRAAQGAVIVSEDWAFYEHDGVDWNQLQQAAEASWKEGKLGRGASTLTQQVVKNVFLSSERSLWRKVREFILAKRIERALDKKKILEIYFNIAEWGEGLFGVTAAARYYFGKTPAQLNAREGAFLAMLLPSPKKYSVSFRKKQLTPFARARIHDILQKMQKAGYLDSDQKMAAFLNPMSFEAVAIAPPTDGTSMPEADPMASEGLPILPGPQESEDSTEP